MQCLEKNIYEMTKDYCLTEIIGTLLKNKWFYVTLNGKKSELLKQKNVLLQGSVLAPMLFYTYTNDQPIGTVTRHFIYADDLELTAQLKKFEEIAERLEDTLKVLTIYYQMNRLYPLKTQVCVFHLKNREEKRNLHIKWNNEILQHSDNPKYLGVYLDRSLTYKMHCVKTQQR
ncbi:unnamed protein product [Macrosiphum euphorbiae]|uniref:Reverse transcriptase domain-containing protein n=1 Tax=Macrosiphum euphorbiae TaxID=13131 RepID=A0AAV0W702_9HEMI|nr:unnamed protein product [Macrosiphum euphorbiae]